MLSNSLHAFADGTQRRAIVQVTPAPVVALPQVDGLLAGAARRYRIVLVPNNGCAEAVGMPFD
jgi:hypothetical protein